MNRGGLTLGGRIEHRSLSWPMEHNMKTRKDEFSSPQKRGELALAELDEVSGGRRAIEGEIQCDLACIASKVELVHHRSLDDRSIPVVKWRTVSVSRGRAQSRLIERGLGCQPVVEEFTH